MESEVTASETFLGENICKALPRGRRQEKEFLGSGDPNREYQSPSRLNRDRFNRDSEELEGKNWDDSKASSTIVSSKFYVYYLWITGDSLVPDYGKVVTNNTMHLYQSNPLSQIPSPIPEGCGRGQGGGVTGPLAHLILQHRIPLLPLPSTLTPTGFPHWPSRHQLWTRLITTWQGILRSQFPELTWNTICW